MKTLAHLLALIALGPLALGPLVPCCVTGHAQDTVVAVDEAPPCHGEAPASAPDGASGPGNCPGCFDCDAGALEPPAAQDAALWLNKAGDAEYATPVVPMAVVQRARLTLTTGPPVHFSRALETPITLKQRLLI